MESPGQFLFKKIKFGAYLMFLLLLYITNRINAERLLSDTVKESGKLKQAILQHEEARSRFTTATTKSQLLKKAYKYDLIESKEPPVKITISKE